MNAQQRIIVVLDLLNRGFVAGMGASTAAVERFKAAQLRASYAVERTTKKSFLQNQVLFTSRRLLFYTTLGLLGLGAAAVKMGFSYQNALNTTRVALSPVITNQRTLNNELDKLYRIAALSPFLFKDTVVAFRQMYAAFKPLGFSIEFTNQTIQGLVDSLSYAGKTSPAALNRVSVALQHLAYLGRPTGQVILQLARDGLPIYAALSKQLGLTGEQIHNIAKSGITAQQVIQALNRYIATTPGFAGAAQRMSNRTLIGAWAQLKDIMSQGFGKATGGSFNFLLKTLQGVNNQLAPLFKRGEPITITRVAQAFDKQLTPATHGIINLFTLFEYTLKGIFGYFYLLFRTISMLLMPIDKLTSLFGANNLAMKAMGIFLGISIGLLLTFKGVMFASREAVLLSKLAIQGYTRALGVLIGTEGVGSAIRGFKDLTYFTDTAGYGLDRYGQKIYKNNGIIARSGRRLIALYGRMTTAATEFDIAANANIVGLIAAFVVLDITLVVLYFKWKKFHDIVNHTFSWLKSHPYVTFFIPVVGQILLMAVAVSRFYDMLLRVFSLLKNTFTLKFAVHTGGILGALKKVGGVVAQAEDPLGIQRAVIRKATGGHVNLGHSPFGQGLGIPGAQEGGTIVRGGMALVGEGGPEIATLPTGASIIPLQGNGPNSVGANFPEVLNLKAILRVDGRDLAEVVAQHRLDRQARR